MGEDKVFLCKTGNGKPVYYDPVHSHAATHFDDTPELKQLVIEALATQQPGTAEYIPLVIHMHRIVGATSLVDIDETDDMIYAVRKNRTEDGLVPFTKSRSPKPCTTVAIWLRTIDKGYELFSAWIGTIDDTHFPQHSDATAEDTTFWSNHAFVWGSQATIPGTETTIRPW